MDKISDSDTYKSHAENPLKSMVTRDDIEKVGQKLDKKIQFDNLFYIRDHSLVDKIMGSEPVDGSSILLGRMIFRNVLFGRFLFCRFLFCMLKNQMIQFLKVNE